MVSYNHNWTYLYIYSATVTAELMRPRRLPPSTRPFPVILRMTEQFLLSFPSPSFHEVLWRLVISSGVLTDSTLYNAIWPASGTTRSKLFSIENSELSLSSVPSSSRYRHVHRLLFLHDRVCSSKCYVATTGDLVDVTYKREEQTRITKELWTVPAKKFREYSLERSSSILLSCATHDSKVSDPTSTDRMRTSMALSWITSSLRASLLKIFQVFTSLYSSLIYFANSPFCRCFGLFYFGSIHL